MTREPRSFAPVTDRVRGLGGERWAVHARARELAHEGREVLFLSIGDPDFATPAPVVDAATAALHAGRTSYSNGRGEPAMLEAIADRYTARTGREVGTDQVIFLPGAQTALAVSMICLVGPGDDVMVPEPYYATYEGVVGLAGANLRSVPLDPDAGFHLDAEELAARITPAAKVLLLTNPHNPTGATLRADEIDAIGEVCATHDLWIVSDEVYADLAPDGHFTSPFDRTELADRTVVVSSVSKSHAMTGWRCGWLVASADTTSRFLPVAESMLFGSQPFLQDAAAHALRAEDASTRAMRAAYQRRAAQVHGVLSTSSVLVSHPPEAGIFMMVDARATGLSGVDFAFRLLEDCGVAVMPGESFGPSAAGHVRISLTNDDEILAEAARRIVEFADQLGAG